MLLAKYDYSLLVVKNIWILRVHQCIRDLVVSTGMAKQDIFVWFFLGFFFTDFCSLLFVFFFFFGILRVHQNALARYAGKHRNGKLANRIFCQYCESVVVNKAVWIWWQLVSILSGDLFSVTAATKHSSQPEDCFTLHLNFNLNFNFNKYFNKHFNKYFNKHFYKYLNKYFLWQQPPSTVRSQKIALLCISTLTLTNNLTNIFTNILTNISKNIFCDSSHQAQFAARRLLYSASQL